ncbi:MAG TPA: hypothetical protein VEV84_05315 [Pyrinomonadaceae bacterium]|nr:hypothetical protein [Pyrinomonadaceae bacterium]
MYASTANDETLARLNQLIILNAENARSRSEFKSDAERRAFLMMRKPVNFERSFATFGGFLGTFPPASIYLNIYVRHPGDMGWLLALFVLANILTAITGYFLGALVGKVARMAEQKDWITMTVFLTIVGGTWGLVSGFTGGIIIFLVGAFFGGALGLIVGAAALPIFAIFHRLINSAGYIDRPHLTALTASISLTIAAFIFGL